MKKIYPKIILVLVILLVALVMNFRYELAPVKNPEQVVKKEVIIKTIYVQVPVRADSSKADTTIITLPKQPIMAPVPDLRKFRRSRNLHRNGFVS